MSELPNIVRFIVAYEKVNDGYLAHEYRLKSISMKKLRSFFNVQDITNPFSRDMIESYPIDKKIALLLHPYISQEIDLNKYDYFLEARFKKGYVPPKNSEYFLPPEDLILPGFPEARPIKPR